MRVAVARPLPVGVEGPEAAALADRISRAVDADAWARTGAVRWRMFGASYLWDRERNLVRYEDGKGVVLTEGWRPMGRAFRDGAQVGGAWKDERVAKAYAEFVNASFWAFAPFKLEDTGAALSVVPDGLLVTYPSGGVTPGDAYQWEIAADGTPTAWRMWVSVLPLPGARATWADWVTLPTGARVATTRHLGPVTLRVEELQAGTLAEIWDGEDPFAAMMGP